MIIAIDFDGTLTMNHDFPKIGEPRQWLIERLKYWRKNGHKLILWTCREDVLPHERAYFSPHPYLTDAINWCKTLGLEFDAVNQNLVEITDPTLRVSRKIFADFYIDDKSVTFTDSTESLTLVRNFIGSSKVINLKHNSL